MFEYDLPKMRLLTDQKWFRIGITGAISWRLRDKSSNSMSS
jgi:hypothetical protein